MITAILLVGLPLATTGVACVHVSGWAERVGGRIVAD